MSFDEARLRLKAWKLTDGELLDAFEGNMQMIRDCEARNKIIKDELEKRSSHYVF